MLGHDMSHPLPKRRQRDEYGFPIFTYERGCFCHGCTIERAVEDSWCLLSIQKLGDRYRGARAKGQEERADYLMEHLCVALMRYESLDGVVLQ